MIVTNLLSYPEDAIASNKCMALFFTFPAIIRLTYFLLGILYKSLPGNRNSKPPTRRWLKIAYCSDDEFAKTCC